MTKLGFSEFDFSAGYKLLESGFLSNEADQIPFVQQCHEFSMRHMSANAWTFYSDPESFVYGALKTAQDFGFDTPDMCWDAYNVEAEAIGCDIAKFDDLTPAIDNTSPLVTCELDLARLKPLDLNAGRIPFAMNVSALFKEVTGEEPYLVYCAPFTLASHLMTFETLVLQMQDNPTYVHKVMTYITDEVLAPYINEFCRRFPSVAVVPGSDAVASLPFITLDMMEEFALHYIERLRSLTDNKAIVDNWWGDSFVDDQEKFWEFKLRANPLYLKVQDPDLYRVGAQRAKDYAVARDLPVMFGVSNNLLTTGPAEEIEKRIHEYLEIAEPGGKNLLYLCNFSSETPPEFVKASVDAIKKFRAGDRPWLGQHTSGSPEAADYEKFDKKTAAEKKALAEEKDAAPVKISGLSEDQDALLDDLFDYVVDGETDQATAAVNQALADNIPLNTILDDALIAAMEEVGMMLEGAGYKVVDLGVNNSTEEILEKARELKPDVIGLSALLTTTMPNMSKVIKAFKAADEPYPIIVGGAPVTQEFADVIGADGYGPDAPSAVKLVHSLVEAKGGNWKLAMSA